MGYCGIPTAALDLVGMFRNVTDGVDSVAEVNNGLPVVTIVFGVGPVRFREQAT